VYAVSRGLLTLAALLVVAFAAQAQPVAEFYRGKTITLIVPADPGGSYDLHSRLIARHIGKRIPGEPSIVVQNMTGAGGLRAINYLYEKAPQDGSVLGMPVQENTLADVLGQSEARYKAAEFNWIGRMAPGVDVIATWWTSGVRTIADATRAAVPLGSTGPASGTSLFPLLLNNLAGTKFDIIPGYKHTEMLLAIERGETYGAFTSLATLKTAYPTWIPNKRVHLLVAISPEPVAELAGIPDLLSLAKNQTDRRVFSIFATASTVGRSLLTTPGVPAERVAALRNAFEAMTRDAEFIADVGKTKAELGPMPGAALQKLIADSRDVPTQVLERARAAVRR